MRILLSELAASINQALPSGVTVDLAETATTITISVFDTEGSVELTELNTARSPKIIALTALDAATDFMKNIHSTQWPATESGQRASAWVDVQPNSLCLGYRDNNKIVLELTPVALAPTRH